MVFYWFKKKKCNSPVEEGDFRSYSDIILYVYLAVDGHKQIPWGIKNTWAKTSLMASWWYVSVESEATVTC